MGHGWRGLAGPVLVLSLAMLFLPSCGDDDPAAPEPTDDVPPSRVEDLSVSSTGVDEVSLAWTAPGDDGSEGRAALYDVRYTEGKLTASAWDSATVVSSVPVPRPAGSEETLSVGDLPPGALSFALRTADEAGNWSDLSNVAVRDIVAPPLPPDDLAFVSATSRQIVLKWTSPAETGRPLSAYDLRYSTEPITEESWPDAVQVQDLSAPAEPGVMEGATVRGLARATTHYFRIRAVDDWGVSSAMSTELEAETAADQVIRLTFSLASTYASAGDWSPDGDTIAFFANWSAPFQVFTIPTVGGSPTQLTQHPYGAAVPRWSTDGQRLSVTTYRSDGLSELSVMDARPGAPLQLLASHVGGRVGNHEWSPDGTQIAYVVVTSRVPHTADIYTVPAGGGTPTLVITGYAIGGTISWSPDGTRIGFSASLAKSSDVFTVAIDGSDLQQLTDDPASDVGCTWSPDGQTIVFASDRSGVYDIWQVPASGGTATHLLSNSNVDAPWSFAPDGRALTFTRTATGVSDVWLLYLD